MLQDLSNSRALSVEERMRWIEGRETLREEDIYYSLFSVFGVTPGANCGERMSGAQRRLLQAIRQKHQPGESRVSQTKRMGPLPKSNVRYDEMQADKGWPDRSPDRPVGRLVLFDLAWFWLFLLVWFGLGVYGLNLRSKLLD